MTDFEMVRSRVDRLRRNAAKAEGALEQITTTLKKEFNCGSIEEAQEHLEELKETRTKLQKKFEKLLADFVGQYGEQLGVSDDV